MDLKVSDMTIRGDKAGMQGTAAIAASAIPAAPIGQAALQTLALITLALGGLLLLIRP
ncbi:hypothetical protein NML43_04170 [Rhodopseudomonas palustris]|jgi:hypothetical protein|uniref:hypothetical protein n=2 Tax=Rhodopseudomonas TaxID=1073 RepID=UPI0020CECE11|nr:hypothetical protein [Rhodopseudomonas palustris]MCP9626283.1 hypothetical protein [Rhodopseudomonas palustris]